MTIPVWFQDWYNNGSGGIAAAAQTYIDRVEADGGAVESIGCVPSAVWDWTAPSFIGLLDLFPNAATAYSLRKLRAAYSGNAIRVRKEVSAVSSETDIGFLADGSLDTVSLLAFASDADSGDVFVVTWYDQSLSNDATQGTGANQPKIVSSGAVITEGTSAKPAIDFDGVNDLMNVSILLPDELSTFEVMKPDIAIYLGDASGGGSGSTDYYRNQSSTSFRVRVGGNNIDYVTTSGLGNQRLINVNRDSSDFVSVSKDGVLASGGQISSGTMSIKTIGSFTTSCLLVAQEFIIYPSDQSTNRAAIEANINDFYSIY